MTRIWEGTGQRRPSTRQGSVIKLRQRQKKTRRGLASGHIQIMHVEKSPLNWGAGGVYQSPGNSCRSRENERRGGRRKGAPRIDVRGAAIFRKEENDRAPGFRPGRVRILPELREVPVGC